MLFPRRYTRFFIIVIVLLATSSLSLGERRERLIDEWRPIHYEVSITLNHKLSQVLSARTEITARILKEPTSQINIDFGEMAINSVTVNGKPVRFVQAKGKLVITLAKAAKMNSQLRIAVAYHGRPKDGLIFSPDKDGTPSVTGDNWPDRVHHWIPTLDHPSAKATVRFTITAPARNLVVANGRLESTTSSPNNTRTWVWNESVPISPYCMIMAVGDFARFESNGQDSIPLIYYVPKSDSPYAMQGFAPAAPSLKFFSETVGAYPYEKLAMVVGATRFGGMENSSAIVFSSGLFKDFQNGQPRSRTYGIPTGVRDVVAHEIAHQWFGDSVTEATWADLWLSEGFATYFNGLFIERYESKDDFLAFMKEIGEKYFDYEKKTRTPIHDRETEDLNALLNPNNYEKGAWVLHMLRGLTGDKAFFEAIRNYYATHRNSTATTEDLRAAMEKSSGLDLKDFFRQWVYESGHPKYEVSWRWIPLGHSNQTGFVNLVVRQAQDGDAFLIPLTVEIVSAGRTQRVTITPTTKEATAQIPVSHQPTAITIDPDQIVLKEIKVVRRD